MQESAKVMGRQMQSRKSSASDLWKERVDTSMTSVMSITLLLAAIVLADMLNWTFAEH